MLKYILLPLFLSPSIMAASATIQATAHVEPVVGVNTINDTMYVYDGLNIYQYYTGIKNVDVKIERIDSTIVITIIQVSI